ncbi:hypothetical protein IWX90DRAFT_288713 [Phyllosticta citrichinensis]|uniref:Uncharacterized protein n=1 Tax=Phyllosticta citrichinensis TaxID=1130410 RepID=A0ABR1XPB8_9PEZI
MVQQPTNRQTSPTLFFLMYTWTLSLSHFLANPHDMMCSYQWRDPPPPYYTPPARSTLLHVPPRGRSTRAEHSGLRAPPSSTTPLLGPRPHPSSSIHTTTTPCRCQHVEAPGHRSPPDLVRIFLMLLVPISFLIVDSTLLVFRAADATTLRRANAFVAGWAAALLFLAADLLMDRVVCRGRQQTNLTTLRHPFVAFLFYMTIVALIYFVVAVS